MAEYEEELKEANKESWDPHLGIAYESKDAHIKALLARLKDRNDLIGTIQQQKFQEVHTRPHSLRPHPLA